MKLLILAFALFVSFLAIYEPEDTATHRVVCMQKCNLVEIHR